MLPMYVAAELKNQVFPAGTTVRNSSAICFRSCKTGIGSNVIVAVASNLIVLGGQSSSGRDKREPRSDSTSLLLLVAVLLSDNGT